MVYAVAVKPEVRRFLSRIGRKGGLARSRNRSQAEFDATARQGAISRWIRTRFGTATFEELGIPGWEIVDKGLNELGAGKTDGVSALAVAEVQPRLRYLGVPVPRIAEMITAPREKLYHLMEMEHGELAHERFSSFLQRVDSFCDALSALTARQGKPRRDRIWCR